MKLAHLLILLSTWCIFCSAIASSADEEVKLSEREKQIAKTIFCGYAMNFGVDPESLSRMTIQLVKGSTFTGADGFEVNIRTPFLRLSYDYVTGMPRSIFGSVLDKEINMSLPPKEREQYYPNLAQAKLYLKQSRMLEHLGFKAPSLYEVESIEQLKKYPGGQFELHRMSQGYNFDDELLVLRIIKLKDSQAMTHFSSSMNYQMKAPMIDEKTISPQVKSVAELCESLVGVKWVLDSLTHEGVDDITKNAKEDAEKKGLFFCHANDFFTERGRDSIGYDRSRPIALCRRYWVKCSGRDNDLDFIVYFNAMSGEGHAGFRLVTQADKPEFKE